MVTSQIRFTAADIRVMHGHSKKDVEKILVRIGSADDGGDGDLALPTPFGLPLSLHIRSMPFSMK
jgi:hypothetical protein